MIDFNILDKHVNFDEYKYHKINNNNVNKTDIDTVNEIEMFLNKHDTV